MLIFKIIFRYISLVSIDIFLLNYPVEISRLVLFYLKGNFFLIGIYFPKNSTAIISSILESSKSLEHTKGSFLSICCLVIDFRGVVPGKLMKTSPPSS